MQNRKSFIEFIDSARVKYAEYVFCNITENDIKYIQICTLCNTKNRPKACKRNKYILLAAEKDANVTTSNEMITSTKGKINKNLMQNAANKK